MFSVFKHSTLQCTKFKSLKFYSAQIIKPKIDLNKAPFNLVRKKIKKLKHLKDGISSRSVEIFIVKKRRS
jgi:hypothetical protein